MDNNTYYVFSHLGRKHFVFKDHKSASDFFIDFIGNAILLHEGRILDSKETINDLPGLIHASLFLQHGITKDGSNHIHERWLSPPDDATIEVYTHAKELFCKPGYGLCLFGGTGVGKTTIMRFLDMAAAAGYISGKSFEKVSVKKIIEQFKIKGFEVMQQLHLDPAAGRNICIDDLGRDNGYRLLYGDKVNVVGDIIESRYDAYIDGGLITHFTTNYSDDELKKIYDQNGMPVIFGRIAEMTNFLVVKGKNWRLDGKE